MNIDKLTHKMPLKRYVFGADDAAIAAAGAAIIGSGINAAGQAKLNKKTMKFNAEQAEIQRKWSEAMADKQNAWNYERWLEQNEYNSPTAQYQRLRDAGLNPLFYGLDGTGNAGELTAAQPLGYERANMGNMPNPGAAFADTAMQVAQIANIQADTAKKGQETLTEVQQREKIMAEIENTKQQFNNLKESELLTKAERAKAEKDLEWLDRINTATVGAAEAKAKLDSATEKRILELLPGEKEIQKMEIEDFDYKWKKISAEIGKISKETGILDKDLENYALNHLSNGVMGSGISVQNIGKGLKALSDKVKKVTTKKAEDPNYQGEGILAEDNR